MLHHMNQTSSALAQHIPWPATPVEVKKRSLFITWIKCPTDGF